MNSERVTIRQVAQRAGVSIATVSRVFAGTASVSQSLRQRVMDAAEQLGYTPHAVAQSLALGRTKLIGILVPNLANPYVCGVIKRILHQADENGYRLIIADTDETVGAEATLGLNLLQRTDGMVMFAPRSDVDAIASLANHGKPVVVLNRPMEPPWLSTVVVHCYEASYLLGRHLIDVGHRRLAYLQGPALSWQDGERWRALRSLRSADVDIQAIPCGGGLSNGYEAAAPLLDSGATAVLAYNDMVAFGVLAGLAERGVKVPEQMSVCGFDDVPFARCVTPTLTTARGMMTEAGSAAWQVLSALLEGTQPGDSVVLNAEPVYRSSTAPPS